MKVSVSSSPLLPSCVFKGMTGDDTGIANNSKNDTMMIMMIIFLGGGKIRN